MNLNYNYPKNILLSFEDISDIHDVFIAEYDEREYRIEDKSMYNLYQSYADNNANVKFNNCTRLMLTGYVLTHQNKLSIKVKKTDWIYTNFIWNRYCVDLSFRNESQINLSKNVFYPNSLCLHLIVETSNNKILLCRISDKKKNDFPHKWAASIGEQLEVVDFNNKRCNFIELWLKRAIREEFSIQDKFYDDFFDYDSVLFLGLVFEEYLYNFSFVCRIKSKLSNKELSQYLKGIIPNNEITDYQFLDIMELRTLISKCKREYNIFHPSTLTRLSLLQSYYHNI